MSRSSRKYDLCKFGVPILDEVIGGGVPRGSVLLVEDNVGVDAEGLLIQFIAEGITSGEYSYILSTEHLYNYYRSLLIPFGIDEIVVETKRLVFIDAFSNPFGQRDIRIGSNDKNVIQDLSKPRVVTDKTRQALLHVRDQNIRGVIDTLSTILLIADGLKGPLSFLQHKIAYDKQADHVTIFTLHQDCHDEKTVKIIEHYADGVIRLSKDTDHQDILEIVKMRGLVMSDLDTKKFRYSPKQGEVELTPL